jgi:uncharacterized protein YfcZ (UPF0381/DUF406 family)
MEKKLFEVTDTCTITHYYRVYANSEEDARNSVCYLKEEQAYDVEESSNCVVASEIDDFDDEFDLVWDFDENRSHSEVILPVSDAAKQSQD